jgi:hypothetical protein
MNCLNCGTTTQITTEMPENWAETGYKILVLYKFSFRHKLGKIECDCKEIIEHYQAWYGITWYHEKNCSLLKYANKYPQIGNLWQFAETDFSVIAMTD